MMYGEELHVINGAIGDASLAAAVNINAAANTVALLKTMELPGSVLYWGFRVSTAFDVHDVVTPGLLTLYRYTKTIQTAIVGGGAGGGVGYAVGDLLSVTQAGASGGILRVLTVAAGVILTYEIVNPGVNYVAEATLATVALNGGGSTATVTISDKKAIDTMILAATLAGVALTTIWAVAAGKQYMKRVPITIGDTSPTPAPPQSYKAGEGLAIEVTTMVNGDVHETGAYQPIIIVQNRGENFAGQPLWVTAV
jgi:hypothetical protein